MSKRLQVILDDREMRALRSLAVRERVTVSAWVRQAIHAAGERKPGESPDKKIQAVRTAAKHRFPTADIGRMIAEIESGYGNP